MNIECLNDGWITNYEVYASLKARSSSAKPAQAAEIEKEVVYCQVFPHPSGS